MKHWPRPERPTSAIPTLATLPSKQGLKLIAHSVVHMFGFTLATLPSKQGLKHERPNGPMPKFSYSRYTSIKTRIETAVRDSNSPHQYFTLATLPSKQGLKLRSCRVNRGGQNRTLATLPSKQGLKHRTIMELKH